jgi:hypothetical protein
MGCTKVPYKVDRIRPCEEYESFERDTPSRVGLPELKTPNDQQSFGSYSRLGVGVI